uniref:Methionine aminopeptidase n=1 Tax=candidate division CPR3 bacterium TaxID=2268181 RepID=A0A7V3J9X4_UNCC3
MIHIYNQKEIEILREGGRILASILEQLVNEVKIGVTSKEIDEIARQLIAEQDATPSFLGYRGFPAAVCISVNDEIVHGLPKDRVFQKNDIVSLDLGLRYKGLCVDKAVTFSVSETNPACQKFLNVVKKSLDLATEQARPGQKLGSISETIQETIEKNGYSVVKDLFGHGVGKRVHEEPTIPNFGRKNSGPVLLEGMVLAIEPMAAMGSGRVELKDDGFTIVSWDGSLTAHFENTVAVTKKGPKVLTIV